MIYNFDEIIDRKNTSCSKYDALDIYFGYEDLQPLWVADMDFKTPDVVNDVILERVKKGLYGYPIATQRTFDAVKNWMKKKHNWQIDNSWITFVNGVVPAYSAAIEAFSEEGDEVIVQTPVYFPLFKHIKSNNRVLVTNPLKENNGYYTMDLEDLKKKITPKTKIFVLCSPHNPVGRVWSKEELKELAQICLDNNILIISDEIHSDIVFKKFTPIATISDEIAMNTLTLNSPGKTFNTAGLKCGYAISKNSEIMNTFKTIIEKREVKSINIFGFTALEAAYELGDSWLDELLIYLKKNINFTKEFLEKNNSKINFLEPEATYLLWLSFKKITNDYNKVKQKLLEESKVALNEGSTFGREGKGYFRLNCALPQSELEKGLSKIVTFF
ncbi:aminotransferase [Halarcobacter ebronensis]|uniref:cysteine-S-conjugate beta-lyase n=1 Tax=Halarcobacter ebronensis TaxID=1462615 RepID=A0A4Q0Y6D0_9BACT|nr:MalY/PatB family protein [Halarcobacter ebronensis]RXJ65726.1 aminotransferase [Halarcobacter ebronensis]